MNFLDFAFSTVTETSFLRYSRTMLANVSERFRSWIHHRVSSR